MEPWFGARLAVIVGAAMLATPGPAAADPVPQALVGTWQTGSASALDFVNPTTGSHGAPSGYHRTIRILGDGRYEDAELKQVTLYGCQTGYFGRDQGVVVVSGSKLSLRSSGGTLRQWATCGHRDNTKKIDGRSISAELNWQIVADPSTQGGRILVLNLPDGKRYATLKYDASAPGRP